MKKLPIVIALCSFFIAQITTPNHVSGKSHLRMETPFASGSPMRASIFNHEMAAQHGGTGKKGGFQFAVYGGKNTRRDRAASYFLPYENTSLTFQGMQADDFTAFPATLSGTYTANIGGTPAANPAEDYTAIIGITSIGTEDVTLRRFTKAYDNNTDRSIVRPWNFGITYAATQDIYGGAQAGDGIYSYPTFKSTISPEFHHSNFGVAAAFRYNFSDNPKSFWFEASTAVEWVKNEIKLKEVVETAKTDLTVANFPAAAMTTPSAITDGDIVTFSAAGSNVNDEDQMKSEVSLVWLNRYQDAGGGADADPTGAYWPAAETDITNGGNVDIENVTAAFTGTATNLPTNKVWSYGKVAGARKKTRLADVELKMGYNFVCEPNYKSDGYLGVIVPTGNKADGEYLGEALVGNGKHFGMMMGGMTEVKLSSDSDWCVSYRLDINSRYLFRNTQKRSFDLEGNEWSRYLMVWEKDNWTDAQAVFASGAAGAEQAKYSQARNYSAGINFFTKDMYVTPGFQGRLNQALHLQARNYQVELGWNVSAREAEKVSLTTAWAENIAFPEATISPFVQFPGDVADNPKDAALRHNGLLLAKNNKTYNNDALSTTTGADTTWNSAFEITSEMLDLESAASPQSVSHTPYASFNYAWGDADSDYPGYVGLGGSYKFTQTNRDLNQWQLWGKLGLNF